MSEGKEILYEVKDKVTIITLNLPERLNALNSACYLLLGKLMERANEEEDTVVTLLQSTGRYFSAGADFNDKGVAKLPADKLFSHEYWLGAFAGRNLYLTDIFSNHKKVLVTALNGPVIGLSAGIVFLSDLVYAIDENKVSVTAPFSKLGLVAEGASSATFFQRLGWAKASEAIIFGQKIPGTDLNKAGLFNKSYHEHNFKTTEEFNAQVLADLQSQYEGLYEPSILANKQLLKANRDLLINSANSREAVEGFFRWTQGIPQSKFAEMLQDAMEKKEKSKL